MAALQATCMSQWGRVADKVQPDDGNARFMFYNFTRIHSTLRVSPAMAANVTDRLWDMSDIVALINAREETPKRPTTYRKRAA